MFKTHFGMKKIKVCSNCGYYNHLGMGRSCGMCSGELTEIYIQSELDHTLNNSYGLELQNAYKTLFLDYIENLPSIDKTQVEYRVQYAKSHDMPEEAERIKTEDLARKRELRHKAAPDTPTCILVCPRCGKIFATKPPRHCDRCFAPLTKIEIPSSLGFNLTDSTKFYESTTDTQTENERIAFESTSDAIFKEYIEPMFTINREDKHYLMRHAKCFGSEQEYVLAKLDYDTETNIRAAQSTPQNSEQQYNIPHCPTCGSVDLKQITTGQKVASAAMLGLYSNKRRCQFHCNACGYEW